jgi:hypothetical protein
MSPVWLTKVKTMTKMHFARLAAAMAAAKRCIELEDHTSLTVLQFEIIVDQLALACSELDPKFDYDRFVDACNKPCEPVTSIRL